MANDATLQIKEKGRILDLTTPLPATPDGNLGGQCVADATQRFPAGRQRFTLDGGPELENHLASVCATVAREVKALIPARSLDGILLGGGYGRGEGGVLRSPSGDQPYNDLEFYVFAKGNALLAERRFRPELAALGRRLSPAAGLEVEFKVLTFEKLRRSAPSMFYYDLVAGHRWLIGDDSLLAGCAHHLDAREIPLHEAARLLLNRCSGLLFAAERLQRASFGPDDADFVARNLAKARLALGDVLLALSGQYHWSCRERHRRLAALGQSGFDPDAAGLLSAHAVGVAFKLRPERSAASRAELAEAHADLRAKALKLWLRVETLRLGRAFGGPPDYASDLGPKCPETAPWRNWLVNIRTFGPGAGFSSGCLRYPRERLFRSLCLLLWVGTALSDPSWRSRLQGDLRASATDFSGLVTAYENLWHRFN